MTDKSEEDLLAGAQSGAEDADAQNAFVVDLGAYEGPLHLLLEMARKQKVDLLHISILELANQYLEFVKDAREKRVDIAADYLLMAAWLAFLKSKLLMAEQDAPEEEDGEGMAGRLTFQLARLDAMRTAAKHLFDGEMDGRDVFRRGDPQLPSIIRVPLWECSLHDMMKAFGDVNLRKHQLRKHVIRKQPVASLDGARRMLVELAKELDDWAAVQSLTMPEGVAEDAPRRSVVASFFSAALELTRDGALDIRQDTQFADVYVRKARALLEANRATKAAE